MPPTPSKFPHSCSILLLAFTSIFFSFRITFNQFKTFEQTLMKFRMIKGLKLERDSVTCKSARGEAKVIPLSVRFASSCTIRWKGMKSEKKLFCVNRKVQFQKVAAVRKARDEWLKGLFPILPSRFLSPPDILLLAHKKSSNIINTFTVKNSISPTNKYLETVTAKQMMPSWTN